MKLANQLYQPCRRASFHRQFFFEIPFQNQVSVAEYGDVERRMVSPTQVTNMYPPPRILVTAN